MFAVYNIFVKVLHLGMKIGANFSPKLKQGVEGRKQSLVQIKKSLTSTDEVIWMHAASLGEYEQGLPVLEKLKTKFPHCKILITFFSPSGYEHVIKRKHIADVITYLPFDQKKEVEKFVQAFTPRIFFTVKYDYWYHLFEILKSRRVPIYVVSALFYPKQVFFKPWGNWFVGQLGKNVDWFFHQTSASLKLAQSIGLQKSSVSGDTRFDRVKTIRNRDNHVDFINAFKQDKKLVIFGSAWEAEERIAHMLAVENSDVKIIIAPHDLSHIESIKKLFANALTYSSVEDEVSFGGQNVLIIDSIGLLSKLYSYADIAVVGGGFHSAGLHNILEAATFAVPAFFGNHYKKNPEADGLIEEGGAIVAATEDELLTRMLDVLSTPEKIMVMGEKARHFVDKQPNSSEIIVEAISSQLEN